MADLRISDLTAASAANTSNLFEIEIGGQSFKLTLSQIIALLNTGLVPAINVTYANIAARDLDEASLEDKIIVEVTDASSDPNVVGAVKAWYIHNSSTNDFTLLSSEEKVNEINLNEQFDIEEVALSTTIIDLDFSNQRQKRFGTTTAHSADFSITKTNDSNAALASYWFTISTPITITLESDDFMGANQTGWNAGAKELSITNTGKYELVYEKGVDGNMYVTLSDQF